ncbi:hypothetical protein N7493_000580 [Penicillium malachiteum]|uniref:FAD-binding domain-containing protein n=1 Tax=Penicillium malachiteum TaxID=1324776 RepID=A0AAD6HWL2_9EURO|nr:hypothetical protein N7493_000580 [Penicillium malachiteum]
MTRKGKRQDLLRDFSGFNPTVTSLLELTTEILDVWGIFDLGEYPLSSFRKGRVCVIGDAAHATSPHHGSGAGFCIEDSAILATLLADQRVDSHDDLAMALEAFSSCRKERTQWLVRSSRLNGDVYQCQAPGIGNDPTKIEQHLLQEHTVINDVSVLHLCGQAMRH